MQVLKNFLAALALFSAAIGASASPAEPKAGAEYIVLPSAQPTDTGKKIEVIEFFAYWCPHCNSFEPALAAWVKKQGDNIVFKRVHVPYREETIPQQKLYFTLDAMGLADKLQSKVFEAYHVDRNRLNTDALVFAWAEKNGIDKAKFIETYNSFGVTGKLRRATAQMDLYKVEFWPVVIVDGRFQTSPHQAGTSNATSETEQQQAAIQVLDVLVAKAKAEKK
jgi:thiol:disulfide interchange protein DsbA